MKAHAITLARAIALAAALGLAAPAVAGQPPAKPSVLSPPDMQLTPAEREELTLGQRPESWFATQLKGPREVVDGQRLNAKLQFLMERTRKAGPPETREAVLAEFDTPEKRAKIRASVDRRWAMRTQVTQEMASVEDRMIPGRDGSVPVRIYRPAGAEGPLPVLVYYHGGGFVFASVKAIDRVVRLIANEAKVVVVSVDYRLAPEHPYPAAHDDAEDAFRWAAANAASFGGDPARMAVGGDSAGGNLALSTSLRAAKGDGPKPLYQLLYYPAVGLGQDEASYDLFDEGYSLDRGFMEAVTQLTFPKPADRVAKDAEILSNASLAGMPATIVVTAGFDPLRDQGRRLARRLQADGVGAVYLNYDSLTHSFLNWSGVVEEAEAAARETAAVLGRGLRSRPGELALRPKP